MQKLTPEVIRQLNNLGGGFPPRPSSDTNEPQSDEQWAFGDWAFECRVRPGVLAVGDLPAANNTLGDVRFVIGPGAWYWWNGSTWLLVIGDGSVDSVTASSPLASSGGANPNISLTGIVPAANGGTGLAVPGAVGNVLTSTGAGWASAPPSSLSSFAVTFPSTASASSTTLAEVGAVKLPFTVGVGAVGCECLVFSSSPTRARIIVTNTGAVPITYGTFLEPAATTGFRVVTPVVWGAPQTGWIRLTLDQIHTPTAQVSLRGVIFVPS